VSDDWRGDAAGVTAAEPVSPAITVTGWRLLVA